MQTVGKVACVVAVLALAGGGLKHVEAASKDPNQVYGPDQFGEDVGDGGDRIAGAFGDGVGGTFGSSTVAKGVAVGGGAYGASKAWKKWGGRSKDDPIPVPEGAELPTLPGVAG